MIETMEIWKKCFVCHTNVSVTVPRESYLSWLKGDCLIQEALSSLSDTERETILSSLCESCQDTIYKDKDDE